MPISPARAAAFDILLRVESESSYASELLHASTYQRLSTQDHALTTELVMGVLRWRSRLDEEIAQASSQGLSRLDIEIMLALRLALYQFRWLDRIPKRAALHESVELVKRARKRSAAPFVNAVLRKLSTTSLKAELEPSSWKLWPPRWRIHHGWSNAGSDTSDSMPLSRSAATIRRSPQPSSGCALQAVEVELNQEGITLEPGRILASSRRVQTGDVTKTKAFRNGDLVIQDEASQLVALLVGCSQMSGSRILDCCAAPGGKTLAMADQNPAAQITAVELHPHRARLLQELVSPARQKIQTVIADATNMPVTEQFDRVLADVPCSGTGTLSRNPEIKWRLDPHDLVELHKRQLAILRSALAHVKSGGRVVYSTCSLEKEENEDVVEEILGENNSVEPIDCRSELDRLKEAGDLVWPDQASLTKGPYLRTIPGMHPCDGFFAAILERK